MCQTCLTDVLGIIRWFRRAVSCTIAVDSCHAIAIPPHAIQHEVLGTYAHWRGAKLEAIGSREDA